MPCFYTHAHADHIHGIDDLRGFFHNASSACRSMPIAFTMERIREGFGYCLETPAGSNYPPIVEPIMIEDLEKPLKSPAPAGTITFKPHLQQHGDIHSLGFGSARSPIAAISATFRRKL